MSIRRTVNQSSSGAGFCGVVCAKGSWRSPPWLVRCTDRSPLIDDERRQISCRVRRMKPVRTVQRHFGIAAPCSAPGFAHREQHAADAFCGSRIRPAHRIECVAASTASRARGVSVCDGTVEEELQLVTTAAAARMPTTACLMASARVIGQCSKSASAKDEGPRPQNTRDDTCDWMTTSMVWDSALSSQIA